MPGYICKRQLSIAVATSSVESAPDSRRISILSPTFAATHTSIADVVVATGAVIGVGVYPDTTLVEVTVTASSEEDACVTTPDRTGEDVAGSEALPEEEDVVAESIRGSVEEGAGATALSVTAGDSAGGAGRDSGVASVSEAVRYAVVSDASVSADTTVGVPRNTLSTIARAGLPEICQRKAPKSPAMTTLKEAIAACARIPPSMMVQY